VKTDHHISKALESKYFEEWYYHGRHRLTEAITGAIEHWSLDNEYCAACERVEEKAYETWLEKAVSDPRPLNGDDYEKIAEELSVWCQDDFNLYGECWGCGNVLDWDPPWADSSLCTWCYPLATRDD
jgi:hypothetical protein